jgi:molybdopterin synthase sulfur carrier subunit
MINLLFFARLRDDLDCQQESLALPEEVTNVGQLRDLLCQRGDKWQQALNMPGLFVAVNQEVCDWNAELRGGEEVAFFPPVTGG